VTYIFYTGPGKHVNLTTLKCAGFGISVLATRRAINRERLENYRIRRCEVITGTSIAV
jgi:hypothetical protein